MDNENSDTLVEEVANLTAYDAVGKMHRPEIKTVLLCCVIGILTVVWGLMGISPSLTSEIPVLTSHPGHSWTPTDLEQQKYIPEHLQALIDAESGELKDMEDPHEVRITNVQIIDVDGDGKNEVLVCNASQNTVIAYSYLGKKAFQPNLSEDSTPEEMQAEIQKLSESNGFEYQWKEILIGDSMVAPAHATVFDVNNDGQLDVIVSVLGNIMPSDELVGLSLIHI